VPEDQAAGGSDGPRFLQLTIPSLFEIIPEGRKSAALNNQHRIFFCVQSFGLITHEKAVKLYIHRARLN
jgi:hypothetical protein